MLCCCQSNLQTTHSTIRDEIRLGIAKNVTRTLALSSILYDALINGRRLVSYDMFGVQYCF